jgi:hypothetical protein
VGEVEHQTFFFHEGPCGRSFAFAKGREFHIVPAREQIQFVPRALTVAKKDERSSHMEMVRPTEHSTPNRQVLKSPSLNIYTFSSARVVDNPDLP